MSYSRRTEYLMPVLDFEISDLQDNERGVLSAAQRIRLRDWQKAWARFHMAVLVFVVGVLLIGGRLDGDPDMEAIFRLVAFGTALLMISLFGWFHVRAFNAIRRGEVACITGPLRRNISRGGQSGSSYWLLIPGRGFQVQPEIYEAFTDGDTYTLYYLAPLRKLVSAVHHPEGTEKPK